MDTVIHPIPPAPERPDVTRATWRWWEALVVFVIALFVGGLLGTPALVAHSHKLQVLAFALAGEVALGGTTLVWLLTMHRRSIRAIGIPSRLGPEIGMGALAGLGVYAAGVFIVGTAIALILNALSDHNVHTPHQLPTHLSGGQIALAAVTVLVAAPVCEELFFRGFLFRALRANRGFVFSAALSSLAFGAVHYQGGAWQNALLLPLVMCFVGFGLAFIYEWRGTIVANMAAHATFNIIGFVFILIFQ